MRQVDAADPVASTWLSANAGSGKTRVLTDRVARLLLRGTLPQRILCLTYTKAAASEMQNRLFQRLGEWAMLPDATLIQALRDLGEDVDGQPDLLLNARRLFARAIETPGGLKIQTIHAFCSAVLRRFPLEAAVSPDFAEVEERSLQELRVDLLDRIAQGPDAPLLTDLLSRLGEDAFQQVLRDIGKHRDAFSGEMPDLNALFGVARGDTVDQVLADVFEGSELDLLARVLPVLRRGSSNDVKLAAALAPIRTLDLAALETFEGKLLFQGGKTPFAAKLGKIATKATQALLSVDDAEALDALALRLEANRSRRLGLGALDSASALHRFARVWLPGFDQAKAARGWLDFDDLIRLTRDLLNDTSVAQWVLFKLDGGIDHILVDEAQDTSPEQWRVIELLTQEFAAGLGARDARRTIFVVGDRKQSIYSFQGADLQRFEATRAAFRQRLTQAGQGLTLSELKHSFRSSDAVLRLVDACFAADQGDNGLGGPSDHQAFHLTKPGRVDLWPPVEKPDKDPDQPWHDPLDRPAQSDPDIVLARAVAGEIRAMIDRGEQIETRDGRRPVHEGDFLILVRRRKTLFDALIRSCKAQGLEIAGADRLVLADELAVQDLIALLSFLALPEDDLSLAIALRSPLFDWSEDRLFRLAHPRGDKFLWEALRGDPAHEETRQILDDLRDQVDFMRPFEVIERILTRHDGRRRIRARFGAEVDEALEAFVDLALRYEQDHVPSLDGFLGWLQASDAEVKRQTESAGRRVRVMTVHGAKGLEAPIVILPDTAQRRAPNPADITPIGEIPILRGNKDAATEIQTEAEENLAALREQENDRLLYVALTRAESWLIVAGAGKVDAPECWYAKVSAGMAAMAPVPLDSPLGAGLRHQHGDWPVAAGQPLRADGAAPAAFALPDLPPVGPRDRILSPTSLGGAKALAGEGADTDLALGRGRAIHALLEHLPACPPDQRAAQGQERLLAMGVEGDEAMLCLTEVLEVLNATELADVFRSGALVETALSGLWRGRPIWGIIDRLVIDDARVLAVDFKSNRVVPAVSEAVPEGILRQMGAYRHMLAAQFPGRRIDMALVWTATRQFMPLEPGLTEAALDRAALDPAVAPS